MEKTWVSECLCGLIITATQNTLSLNGFKQQSCTGNVTLIGNVNLQLRQGLKGRLNLGRLN